MGKSNPIATIPAGIQHTLERRSRDSKIAVLGADNSAAIDFMADISIDWHNQGLYTEAERLDVKIVDFRRRNFSESGMRTHLSLYKNFP